MKGDNIPAFPSAFPSMQQHPGMSLRDYFAAHAPEVPGDFNGGVDAFERKARLIAWRWFYADAMLAERDK